MVTKYVLNEENTMKYVFPVGSSHSRNLFCEESFVCAEACDLKGDILRKYIPLGIEVLGADHMGVDEMSMTRFIDHQKGVPTQNTTGGIYCCVMGEIDIRVNVGLASLADKDIEKTLEDLTNRYIAILPKAGSTLIIAVQPPLEEDLDVIATNNYLYRWSDKKNAKEDPRGGWTKTMNHILKDRCEKNNITFFDPWSTYKLKNGFVDKKNGDGICHIKDTSRALEETLEFILNNM